MSPNKEVSQFFTILSFFGEFFVFVWNLCLLCYITLFHLYSLLKYFFVNLIYFVIVQMIYEILLVHNDFNATNDFITWDFLNFTYSFVEVNVDVSYDHNSSDNNNTVLIFLFLTSSFFSFSNKMKTWCYSQDYSTSNFFCLLVVLQNIFTV